VSGKKKLPPEIQSQTWMRPFHRSLPMQLMRARESVLQRFRPRLRAKGVSEQQWRVIRVLAEDDWVDMRELAARCNILPASLSRMVPLMERMGLVQRKPDAKDQRRNRVALSAKGRTLFSTTAVESERIYEEIAQAIGAEKLAALYKALDHVIDTLGDSGMPEEDNA
jgi:homoprotocatechuate degradation regulator HpaR